MQDCLSEESRSFSVSRLQRWFGGTHILRRAILILSFLVTLAAFFHFREEPIESVEIGTLAPRYVIAQIDFDFPDAEATQVLKQEAVKDIGSVYAIKESQVKEFRYHLEKTLIDTQKWREELPQSTFEEIYEVLDKIEDQLLSARFTDERTLQRMRKLNLSADDLYAIKVSARHLTDVALPKSFWEQIEKKLEFEEQPHEETVPYLESAFSSTQWDLAQDYVYERAIKQSVQNHVPQRYSHVDAGTQIIKRGEKITSRHITMLSKMAIAIAESRNLWSPVAIIGSFLLGLCVTFLALFYMSVFHRELLRNLRKMTLLVIIIIMTCLFAKISEYILIYQGKNLIELARFPLFVPLATLLITVLIDTRIAFVTSLFLTLIFGTTLAVMEMPFFLINFLASGTTILFAWKMHKRKEVFSVLGKVWLCCIPLILAFNLSENVLWSKYVLIDFASSFVFLAATAIVVIGLLPILESLFHCMTDMTLMEYMDPNNELLRRLSLEAPGTYQHCLVVGNLAEAGARAISANGLFCRVSTLYHDIGKLFNPHYFTENQLSGFNIHQLLTPQESTHVIIAHIPEGEALARKFHLPQSFIDIIREHHGTTMVYYFYCKQVEQMGGDPTKVNEKLFRYPGPKPRSKESGIIMIADTIEAASRSMDEVTEEVVMSMVDQLVAEKIDDGQFDECQLTFEELGHVKRAIVKALMVTRHLRIKYPTRH
jgi:putative nucleotidyltransferase with HDIG domain